MSSDSSVSSDCEKRRVRRREEGGVESGEQSVESENETIGEDRSIELEL